MNDFKPQMCTCGHTVDKHAALGTGCCIIALPACTCSEFEKVDDSEISDKAIITYCKGTKRKHRLLYFQTEANPTSGILTIWYICSHCNHCIVRHYNPKNANCTIVTDEEVDLQDDKGNSI